ncbi:3-hydroxybenzoate 6-hydroxylase [Pseudonocardia sulfidoxydans NBRC 16205]|uniref:3-hydroxybenzoate 6-hydroxylase n=1 Tax=Pseudonocardia sulfidoxydans NBRC 16205 TaxID=1223511 RepID=A0A511DK77_9PSEU|nr:FAD-dependent monooxygenase [Pseudonocardia sulfidoxydans]GEL24827.1 3-hydroxybenzoate 6-hydroxylase [Pseudonocardia sulfidoxydans NBRC 16205]
MTEASIDVSGTGGSGAPVDAIVVGGGIGGLGTALALHRAGRTVRVLEQAAEFGEVGAGLQMAPNATRVLREWGLLDDVIEQGVTPRRLIMRDAVDNQVLTQLDLEDAGRRYGAPYVVIHRSDLHTILVQACRDAGIELVTATKVEQVETGPDHATAVSDQRRDTGSIVVAADGLNSQLRSRLSDDQPISSAYVAYRGAVPLSDMPDQDALALEDVTVFVGPACHFVQYPLRRGEMFNQVAVFQSPKALAGEEDWGTPDELGAAFAGTCESVRAGLPYLWRNRWWRMFDREPIDSWVDGRVVLTGDAAHPMLQYLAQGACQALEDAVCLAEQAEKYHDGEQTDWDRALESYTALRTVRTATVQRRARQWGDLWHCGGLFRDTRNALLRDRDTHDYRYIDWLYGSEL